MSFLKYNVFKMKKPNIDENFFCEYVRTDQQEKLVKLIKQFNVKVSKLKINWDYMSLYDKLDVEFCLTFKKYINFAVHSFPPLKIPSTFHWKQRVFWD